MRTLLAVLLFYTSCIVETSAQQVQNVIPVDLCNKFDAAVLAGAHKMGGIALLTSIDPVFVQSMENFSNRDCPTPSELRFSHPDVAKLINDAARKSQVNLQSRGVKIVFQPSLKR